MSTPVFSIITPTYRRPLLLKRNILSVKNQTFENYEHIIIDDANDPDTSSLVNEFEDVRIIFHQHKTSKGAAGSYNTGIKLARGRFLLFLDDDDEFLPCLLKKTHERFLNSGPDLGFLWTGISRVRDTESGETFLFSLVWPSSFSTKEEGLVAATSIGNGFGLCVKRNCIDKVGLYDESIIFGQDTDYMFRLARNFEFGTIPEVLVKIHQHDWSQLTDKSNDRIRLELRERILLKNLDLLLKFPKLYYTHYMVVVDSSYKLKLKQKGRKAICSIINKTPVKALNFTDLFFYELFGINTKDYYSKSILLKIVRFMRSKMQPVSQCKTTENKIVT